MFGAVWCVLMLLRLAVPLVIFRWPLFGVAASMLIDLNDYNLLPLTIAADYTDYQVWDKLLDLYYLSFMALVASRWQDSREKRVILGLFLWRLLGVGLMEVTGNRALLMVFPNLFENLFLFYLVYRAIESTRPLFRSPGVTMAVMLGVAVPKLLQEYHLHIIGAQRVELLGGLLTLYVAIHLAYVLLPLVLLMRVTNMGDDLRVQARYWFTSTRTAISGSLRA